MTSEDTRPLVLYVDDERANRIVLEHSLKSDFNIVVVDSGEKAIAIFEEREVAVLVTDMRMPGMEGDQLLRIVKDRWPSTIRMVMTAHQDIGPILRAINEGLVARYIIKPFERPELVQVLRWACEFYAFSKDSAALHHRLMETERLATLGSIAGLLVHDLRQPLMSQLVNIEHVGELAKDHEAIIAVLEKSDLDPAIRTNAIAILGDLPGVISDLKQATAHLSEMVSCLRDLGRPRAATNTKSSIDPLPIIRHAMAVCQEVAMKSRTSITYVGPNKLPNTLMNQTELMQVLINIVANAAQAVAARGEPNGTVQISARSGSQMMELEIKDTGIGLGAETLGKVGTPFFTTRDEGTGLGISQVQRLVGNAGGRFSIASKRGEGTTVTITLPTAQP